MKKPILYTVCFWFFGVLCAVAVAPPPEQDEVVAALVAAFVATPAAFACVWSLCLVLDTLDRELN